MVNLLMFGKACSNTHDGDIEFAGSLLKGVKTGMEIGQLSLFEHYGYLKVGNFLKNPSLNIFVICAESHYTVLFSTSDPLELFYYDMLAGQPNEIMLTLEATKDTIPESESPIELCIRTKWSNYKIDWNGAEVQL
jgi:hypothetical protein